MNIQEILKPIAGSFQAWYEEQQDYTMLLYGEFGGGFYSLPLDFQIGVLLRYFREQWGIEIEMKTHWHAPNDKEYFAIVESEDNYHELSLRTDYYLTFETALKKAVELVKEKP